MSSARAHSRAATNALIWFQLKNEIIPTIKRFKQYLCPLTVYRRQKFAHQSWWRRRRRIKWKATVKFVNCSLFVIVCCIHSEWLSRVTADRRQVRKWNRFFYWMRFVLFISWLVLMDLYKRHVHRKRHTEWHNMTKSQTLAQLIFVICTRNTTAICDKYVRIIINSSAACQTHENMHTNGTKRDMNWQRWDVRSSVRDSII